MYMNRLGAYAMRCEAIDRSLQNVNMVNNGVTEYNSRKIRFVKCLNITMVILGISSWKIEV